ncbi:MAG: IS66 family insertion sequence element accessory protein TnpB [Alphaproteobacteria bacterium]|nr:MAG: IS66 family insertion sequence element accessory protein TnpB [Alphaproteobacteria bacterium]
MSDTELLPKLEPVRRLEVFTGAGRRRSWTAEQKLQIISESYADGETVSAVARRHGLTPQQLFGWRRAARPLAVTGTCSSRCRCDDVAGRAVRGEGCVMIIPSGTVRVLVAMRPVDFRKGMDGLAAVARESLGADPYSGVVYVFRAKRADRVKLLLWDGTGLVLVAKRLEKSSFRWPTISDGVMRLTSAQLSALLEGLDWTRVRAVRVQAPQATL